MAHKFNLIMTKEQVREFLHESTKDVSCACLQEVINLLLKLKDPTHVTLITCVESPTDESVPFIRSVPPGHMAPCGDPHCPHCGWK